MKHVIVVERKFTDTERYCWRPVAVHTSWRDAKKYAEHGNKHEGGAWRVRKFVYAGSAGKGDTGK